ncbi:MAG: hypothetical protein ACAI38_05610 [Myxococcota bacterium]|nr:hypothetical protein [Myxococcota bacterium]
MRNEQVASAQSAAIKTALELRPHHVEKFRKLERAITLEDALSALAQANIFDFPPSQSFRHDIAFAAIPAGKASPAAYVQSALGKPYHEAPTGSTAGRATETRYSITFDDGTGAAWESYSANRLALKVESDFEGGGKTTAYYSARLDQLALVIKTANPRFSAQSIFDAASRLPLDRSF